MRPVRKMHQLSASQDVHIPKCDVSRKASKQNTVTVLDNNPGA